MTGRKAIFGLIALYLSVIATAVGLVYSKHLQRQYFIELQAMQGEYDSLRTEWERLQLEDSVWSNHARIEQLATEKLNMRSVTSDNMVILNLR